MANRPLCQLKVAIVLMYSYASFVRTTSFRQIELVKRSIRINGIESMKSEVLSREHANNVNKGDNLIKKLYNSWRNPV